MKKLLLAVPFLIAALVSCPDTTTPPPTNPTLLSILLTCTPNSIAIAATSTCTATAHDSSGTALTPQPAFTFSSSDTTKASVSSAGVVTGVAAGNSSVTALSGGISSNAVALTVTGGVNTGGTIITPPAAAGTNVQVFVLGINNAGHVLYTTDGLNLPNPALHKVWLYNGSSSNEIVFPDLKKTIEDGGCLTSDDSVFLRYGNDANSNATAIGFWNGSSASKVFQMPLAGNGFPDKGTLLGCNDDKRVVFANVTAADAKWVKTWKPGDASVTTFAGEDANINFGVQNNAGVSSSGAFLTRQNKVFGVRNGATWTAFSPDPTAGNSYLYCCYIQKNGAVVYTNDNNLMIWATPQTTAASKIALPPGLTGAAVIRATNTTGRILFSKSGVTPPETWVYSSGAFEKLAPTTASDNPATRSMAINDNGLVAISGKTPDNKLVIEIVQAK